MSEKKVAILQSNYIPWKGYFDIIRNVDVFIFHDDLQYTKQDWRNRNKIKTENGVDWLTIPCGKNEGRLICEVELKDPSWQKKHFKKIKDAYAKASFFKQYEPLMQEVYINTQWTNLSEFNQYVIEHISKEILGFTTIFEDSRQYNLQLKKGERVIELLNKVGADTYLSGSSAKDYISDNNFHQHGVRVEWMDYSNYVEYPQLYNGFVHEVSILDLLFNVGDEAVKYFERTR